MRLAPPLDARWYSELKRLGGFLATHYYLKSDQSFREQLKQRFLENKIRNPSLKYPRVNIHYFQSQLEEIESLKDKLLAHEAHPVVVTAYQRRIDEVISKIRLLEAVGRGDMEIFRSYTEFLYGIPSPGIFAHTLKYIHWMVEQSLESKSKHVREAAKRLDEILPIQQIAPSVITPSPQKIDEVFSRVLEKLQPLISLPTQRQQWSGSAIKEVFTEALRTLKLYEWSVIASDTNYYMSVEHTHKEIRIPVTRTIGRNKLLALLVHEVGTHVVRRVHGIQSGLLLLGSGLDHYEAGEEGVATLYEEAVSGHFKPVIRPERYLAIGMTMGLGGKKSDFRGVYEVLEPYFYLRAVRHGRNFTAAHELAKTRAWETCIRIFRGTDCHTPGVCFTKDIMYQHGNIKIWDVVTHHPEEINRFDAGKYDPANEQHRWILDQLGISTSPISS